MVILAWEVHMESPGLPPASTTRTMTPESHLMLVQATTASPTSKSQETSTNLVTVRDGEGVTHPTPNHLKNRAVAAGRHTRGTSPASVLGRNDCDQGALRFAPCTHKGVLESCCASCPKGSSGGARQRQPRSVEFGQVSAATAEKDLFTPTGQAHVGEPTDRGR